LEPNELFLFKLKKPHHAIVGGGFFVKYSYLPISLTWEAFGRKNGTKNYAEFLERLRKYREKNRIKISAPFVGCIVLTQPFFFEQEDWITPPASWPSNAVVGKTMNPEEDEGKHLFQEVCERLQRYPATSEMAERFAEERYQYSMVKQRLGQGAFRVLVTDAYHRRCAISGEKTLPVLEAAHIKPYSKSGIHHIQNGVLLRADIHKLFDEGYLTIAPDLRVEVSKRLREDFNNCRIYYQYHGQKLQSIPDKSEELPAKDFLLWHCENVYLG
jgi:putative restriction endonuclease